MAARKTCSLLSTMPFQTTWRTHGVSWRYHGLLTGSELLQSNLDIFGDERFDDIRYQIVDLTGVEKIDVNDTHMRKLAHLDMAASRSNPRVKVAVVTTSDAASKLGDLYNQFCEGKSPWVTQLFSHIEDAEAWVRG